MPRKDMALTAPLRQLIHAEVDRVIEDGVPIDTMAVCQAIRDDWQTAVSNGDAGLERDLWREIVPYGIWREADPYIRSEYGTVITSNGKTIKQPRRQGVRMRDAQGVGTQAFKRMLWEEFTWEQYAELLDRKKRQAARLNDRIVIMDFVLSLREKYPDTANPGEAMRREGLDPAEFDIDLAA